MAFSTIKKKHCACKEGCPKYPSFGFGKFYYAHATEEIKLAQGLKAKKSYQNRLNRAKLNVLSKKVSDHQKEVIEPQIALKQSELEQWFDNIARIIARNPYCMECGKWIPEKIKLIGSKQTVSGYRCATAHIFPKAIFESVATHPMNYLILGAGCGCHDKTHRLDTFSDMKIFPEAIRRFRLFEKSITEKHKYLTTFLDYVNGTI